MRATVPCPSDLALEQYLLGELAPSQSHVGDHVATCETCRTKIAHKAADGAAFASSPGAAEILRALSLPASTRAAPTPPGRTSPAQALRAQARPAQARIATRRSILAALAFAAAIALAFLLSLRPPSSVTSRSSAPDINEEEMVLRVQREWMEAVRDKDVATLDRILADDYTYTDSRGGVSNKADSLRQARAGGSRMKAFHTFDEKARIYGDMAVITGRLRVERVAAGEAYDAEVRFTDILARIDGQWRAVAAHASQPNGR